MVSERNVVQKKRRLANVDDERPAGHLTIARMRTGAAPGFLFFAGATITNRSPAMK
jgi:hypothetical protein